MSETGTNAFDGLAASDQNGNLAPVHVDRLDERYQAGGEAAIAMVDSTVTDPTTESGTLVASKVSVKEAPLTPYRFNPATPSSTSVDNTQALAALFDAASVQGAEVYIPPGAWATKETLPLHSGLTVHGASKSSARLAVAPGGAATSLFNYGGQGLVSNVTMSDLYLDGRTGNAHIFDSGADGSITACSFRDMFFNQQAAGASIWSHTSERDILHMAWTDCTFQRAQDSTALPIVIKSNGGANCNVMQSCRFNGLNATSTPFLYVESTGNNYASDWLFQNIIGEQNPAGLIHMSGAANVVLNNVSEWDNWLDTGYTGDIFRFTKNSLGYGPEDITLIGASRRASFMAEDAYDIYVEYGGGSVTVINCNPIPANEKAKIWAGANDLTLLGTRVSTSSYPNTQLAGPLSVWRQSSANLPTPESQRTGTMVFDASLNKPLWSDGTNWRDASGAVV